MKAAFLRSKDDVIIKDITNRPIAPHEVLLKVDACGICGSDLITAFAGQDKYSQFGHEIAGTVIETGSAVKRLQPGQKVVLDSCTACGDCKNCKDSRQDLCETPVIVPFTGFAQNTIAPAMAAWPYENIKSEVACLAEPLGVAIDLFYTCDIKFNDVVLVSGLGPIGLMALQLAKKAGAAKIYACDISSAKTRLELAAKFGADEVIMVDKNPLDNYMFLPKPNKLLITSPPKTMPGLLNVAAKGAIASFIGIEFGAAGNITLDANYFHFNKLQLRSSFASPAMMTPLAIKLLQDGTINGEALISHRFKIDDIKEALHIACNDKANTVKVVMIN